MTDRTSFGKWYERNKTTHNAKRKAKYHSDNAYRESAIERQRQYRKDNPYTGREVNTRLIDGEQVQVYRIGDVAGQIGRTEQVLRLWEKKKIIPEPTIPGSHRYYTIHQIELLKELVEVMDEVRYKPSIRQGAISKKSAELFLTWKDK